MNRVSQNNYLAGIMQALHSIIAPAMYPDHKTPKGRTGPAKEKKKTKKGAIHIKGKHFKSRFRQTRVLVTKGDEKIWLDVKTPALYRHLHLGVTGSYKPKKSPRPRARNVGKIALDIRRLLHKEA